MFNSFEAVDSLRSDMKQDVNPLRSGLKQDVKEVRAEVSKSEI